MIGISEFLFFVMMTKIVMISKKDFIKNVLVNEIKDIQKSGHHYLSFGLISQGIEFLGCCLDEEEYFKPELSRKRFYKAIEECFSNEYFQYRKKMFEDIRCGLLHVCLPKLGIELIRSSEVNDFGKHLEEKVVKGNKVLILVSEDFFKDFEIACYKIIKMIDNGQIKNNILIDIEPFALR